MTWPLALLLFACTPGGKPSVGPNLIDTGGNPIDPGDDVDSPPEDDGSVTDFAPPERGFQLHMGPFDLPAFTEVYRCRIIQAPNTETADIIGLSHQASSTVHHFNVWGLVDAPEREQEGDCDDLWQETNMALASPLYASQTPTFEGWFPDGIAGRIPADQWLLMEYHAVNPTGHDLVTEGLINAYVAEPGTIEDYANGLYGTNADLDLPPQSESSFSKRCTVDVDMNIIVMGSHFHARGTLFEVHRVDASGTRGDLVYSNDNWESPDLFFWTDNPMAVSAGEGFEYTCHYRNDTDEVIRYGPSSSDEMCMFAAVYYPDAGFKMCL